MKPLIISSLFVVLIVAVYLIISVNQSAGLQSTASVAPSLATTTFSPALEKCDPAKGPLTAAAWQECEETISVSLNSIKGVQDPQVEKLRQEIKDTLEQINSLTN